VAYSVRISRVAYDGARALYEWESTNGPAGHIAIDVEAATFRPADASGAPVSAMSFRRGDSDVAGPEAGAVSDFLTVVGGILKRWKETEPPETAHLYFG
jgi:hypothetical protein